MARKLKTYTTSAGFFDLAVAAPSMKAALDAWGAGNNLFQHGFAKVSEDPAIVAATMAKPGVVLRRAVGSNGAFGEHADLPTTLPAGKATKKAAKPPPTAKPPSKRDKPLAKAVDDKAAARAARAATLAFEKQRKQRDSERRREEAAQEKERRRRAQAIAAAEAALEEARHRHDATIAGIEKERAALDRKSEAEDTRWRKQKDALETALRKARSVSYLRSV